MRLGCAKEKGKTKKNLRRGNGRSAKRRKNEKRPGCGGKVHLKTQLRVKIN